jgi:DNA-binding beta-propeller fold protein YncE
MLPVSPTKRLVPAARRLAVKSILQSLCWLAGINAAACFEPDDGREPPLNRIYFPTGMALSPDGDRLYVANSDWDLQYNAGSVQVYDAARLRQSLPVYCESDAECGGPDQICDLGAGTDANGNPLAPSHWCVDRSAPDPCQGLGIQSPADRLVTPGLCGPIDNTSADLLLGSVRVGAFATDLIYRVNPNGGGRLFVPVRSDATLHWIDVGGATAGGELDCGQGRGSDCDDDHRRGDGEAEETPSGDSLPIEPFGVGASLDGTAVLTTHQTEGKVSLFVNDWARPEAGPELSYILEGLPARPVHVSAIPVPEVAVLDRAPGQPRSLGYLPGFWLAFRGTSFIQLVRYFDALDAPDGIPFLESAFADRLATTATNDIRGMAVDASRRSRCEASCAAGDLACLSSCAGIALDVFLANAVPASLLIGNTTSLRRADVSNDRLRISDAVSVDEGPSRTVVGQILDASGVAARRVFITSFDARTVTIYDPDARVVEARVFTGRGPTALAIDDVNALAYVAHFTDSFVGVIDLDRRHHTFGTMIRALGRPSVPRGDP